MKNQFPLFPEQASTMAVHVDNLYFFLIVITVFFSLLIAGFVVFFAIKYRQRADGRRPVVEPEDKRLEIAWTVVPFLITMVIFVWGTWVFLGYARIPKDAMPVFVLGKQWMWKVQHPAGPREINELHVPVGKAVKLTMTSEDVIHSFYLPALRVKYDVVPGRYTQTWFTATKTGVFHIFCAEYCGAEHSRMIGKITVMNPADYETWLAQGSTGKMSMASAGEQLFQKNGCTTCHTAAAGAGAGPRGPNLAGLFGQKVALRGGATVTADESYLRESILLSGRKIVAGYENIMPSFEGQISEEDAAQLIAYIKSLGSTEAASGTAGGTN